MPLTEDDRKQLDSIVSQMVTAGESDDNIRAVVEDFKTRKGGGPASKQPASSPPKPTDAASASPGSAFTRGYVSNALPNPVAIAKDAAALLKESVSRATGNTPGDTGVPFLDSVQGILDTIFPLENLAKQQARQSVELAASGRPVAAVANAIPLIGPALAESGSKVVDAFSLNQSPADRSAKSLPELFSLAETFLPGSDLNIDTEQLAEGIGGLTGLGLSPLSAKAAPAPSAAPPIKLPPGVKPGIANFTGKPTAKKVAAAEQQVIRTTGQEAALAAKEPGAGVVLKGKAIVKQLSEGFSAASYFGRAAFEELRAVQRAQAAKIGEAIATGISKAGAIADPLEFHNLLRQSLSVARAQTQAVLEKGFESIEKAVGKTQVPVPTKDGNIQYVTGSQVMVDTSRAIDFAKRKVADLKLASGIGGQPEAATSMLQTLASNAPDGKVDLVGAMEALSAYEAAKRNKAFGPARQQYAAVADILRSEIQKSLEKFDPKVATEFRRIYRDYAEYSRTFRQTFIKDILANSKSPDAAYRLALTAPVEHIDAFMKVLDEYAAVSAKNGKPLKHSPKDQLRARLMAEVIETGFNPRGGSGFLARLADSLSTGGGKAGAVARAIIPGGAVSDLFGSPAKIAAVKIERTLDKIGKARLEAIFTKEQLGALAEYTKRLKSEPYVLSAVGSLAGQVFSSGIVGAAVKGLATFNPSLIAAAAGGVGMQLLPVIFLNPKAAPVATRLIQAVGKKLGTNPSAESIRLNLQSLRKSPEVALWVSRLLNVVKETTAEDRQAPASSAATDRTRP